MMIFLNIWKWTKRWCSGRREPFHKRAVLEPESLKLQEVLVITHSGDPHAKAILFNLQMALQYAALPSVIHNIDDGPQPPALDTFSVVVLCTELLGKLTTETANELRKFVKQGGGMVVAHRGWNSLLNECFGFPHDLYEPEILDSGDEDFVVVKEILPGARGAKLKPDQYCGNYSYIVSKETLASGCTVLATNEYGRPLCWKFQHGKGRTIFWNTVILSEKFMRGFLIQSILDCKPLSAMRLFGFAMIQIDDSPPPVNDGYLEPISTEYPGMDVNSFYSNVWYPDMMELKRKHSLTFTHYCILNYEDGGTELASNSEYSSSLFGSVIVKRRFGPPWSTGLGDGEELGFHGYNHVPLISDYWNDPAATDAAMVLARKLWKGGVSEQLPVSYVPAGNELHSEQLEALTKAFPELKVICTTYSSGNHANGEFREFGPEPWNNALTCIPRETAGYVMTEYAKVLMLSQLGNLGIWTHYIHPDDVFDIPFDGEVTGDTRNPHVRFWREANADGQEGLHDCFSGWIEFVREHFPWIDFLTTSAAAERFSEHSETIPAIAVGNKSIWINATKKGKYYLRVSGALIIVPAATETVEILDCQELEDGRLYVVQCPAGETTVTFF